MDPSTPSRERDQSRILVDSIDEWKKVQTSFTESMVSKLDAKMKGKSAAEKAAIMGHLMEWRDRTFELAKLNVKVNGIDMEKFVEEDEDDDDLEPYDEVLDRRLWVHFQEGLTWQSTLATRRREEPGKAEALIQDLIIRERQWEMEDTPPMLDTEVKDTKALNAALPERLTEMQELHSETLKILEDWKENLPKLMDKAERVEAVAVVDARITP